VPPQSEQARDRDPPAEEQALHPMFLTPLSSSAESLNQKKKTSRRRPADRSRQSVTEVAPRRDDLPLLGRQAGLVTATVG
jgi:hypothetical protein